MTHRKAGLAAAPTPAAATPTPAAATPTPAAAVAKPPAGPGSDPLDYDDLCELGETWAKSNIGVFKPMNSFYRNAGLKNKDCPARKKYEPAVKSMGWTDCTNVVFGWHATKTLDAARAICWESLDPGRRSGQAYGPGEYFSLDANYSGSWTSTEQMMVFALLDDRSEAKPHLKIKTHHVMNNPLSGTPLWCVPVGIITWGSNNSDPKMKTAP